MTLDDAKQLTLWMRDQGVVQFACDGLSVQFHPRVVATPSTKGAEVSQPKQPESQETEQANLLSRVFPPP